MSDIKNNKLENSTDLQHVKKHNKHDCCHHHEHNHEHVHDHADCCCEHPHHNQSESSDEHDHKHIHHNEYDHKHENEYCNCSSEDEHHKHGHELVDCGCGHEHGHHHHGYDHNHTEYDHCCDACAERSKSSLTPMREQILDTDRVIDLIKIFSSAFLLACGYIYDIEAYFFAAYVLAGYEVIWEAIKSIFRGDTLDENFLMLVSTLGAIYVGQYPEATGVKIGRAHV